MLAATACTDVLLAGIPLGLHTSTAVYTSSLSASALCASDCRASNLLDTLIPSNSRLLHLHSYLMLLVGLLQCIGKLSLLRLDHIFIKLDLRSQNRIPAVLLEFRLRSDGRFFVLAGRVTEFAESTAWFTLGFVVVYETSCQLYFLTVIVEIAPGTLLLQLQFGPLVVALHDGYSKVDVK